MCTRERSLRKHAVHGVLDYALGVLAEHVFEAGEALMTHVARVSEIALLLRLATSDLDLRGIDHNDVVAPIHMGGKSRLVLTTDDSCHFCGESSKHHAFRIHDVPVVVDISRCGGESLHWGDNRMRNATASEVMHPRRFSQSKAGIEIGAATVDRAVVRESCLLYTSPSPRDRQKARIPSSA